MTSRSSPAHSAGSTPREPPNLTGAAPRIAAAARLDAGGTASGLDAGGTAAGAAAGRADAAGAASRPHQHSSMMSNAEKVVTLREHLSNILKGRKFMVVLDDLWRSTDLVDALWGIFKKGKRGSRLLITTQDITVADALQTDLVIHLKLGMHLDEFLEFFNHFVSRVGDAPRNFLSLAEAGKLLEGKLDDIGFFKALKSSYALLSVLRDDAFFNYRSFRSENCLTGETLCRCG